MVGCLSQTIEIAGNMSADLSVLIVGAGPAGLVLACDLARRGVRIRIVERDTQPPDRHSGSRGKGVQPRTLEIYDDLGLIDAVHAAGGPYFCGMGWDGPVQIGEIKLPRSDPRDPTPDVPYPSPWMLPQPRALEILRAHLRSFGTEVEYGVQLAAITPDAEGVSATLAHADGGVETVRNAYLVGADGARGTVRQAVGIPFASEPMDSQPMLTADVVIDGLGRQHWHMWDKAPGGPLWLLPLAQSEAFQLYAKYDQKDPDVSPDGIRRMIHERTGGSDLVVREIYWASLFSSRLGMAEQFRKGRVFLVGDAAHIHSPAGGQGMNTSIQDSYNLGWKLGQVLNEGAPESLLDTYEEERMPVAAKLLNFVGQIHKNWMGTGGAGQPQGDSRQIGLNYRNGTLAVHAPTDGLVQAGDRAPDARLTDSSGARMRLFDIYRGPHFTLLAFGGADLPNLVAPLAGKVHAWRVGRAGERDKKALVDTEGHAHRHYGNAIVVVRPDGYIGYSGPAASARTGAVAYLKRFFSS
ncbi:MAG: FAD-dependent monooxygenase [Xanthobacteraceae bacterium]